jgi:hypothetical protein
MGMKQKKLKKNSGCLKKTEFFSPPILNIFCENFRDLSLGEYNKLMQIASMWVNLYGCQAVQHKLKKGLKMHFCVFMKISKHLG